MFHNKKRVIDLQTLEELAERNLNPKKIEIKKKEVIFASPDDGLTKTFFTNTESKIETKIIENKDTIPKKIIEPAVVLVEKRFPGENILWL
jgi:hypothetical protein